MQYYLEPGNTSISGLPDDTICSFYGSYQLQTSEVVDFEPVQCIMNRPPPPTIPPAPTTTEDSTTTAYEGKEIIITGNNIGISRRVYPIYTHWFVDATFI